MQEAYKTYVCLVLSTTLIRYMMCTQHGRPSLKCNAAQIVLKYLLLHRQLLCKTWRGRLYYFSSGTAFNDIADDLNYYIDNEPKGKKHIPKLKDVGMLRELVGDAIVAFINLKKTFFKDAMLSKVHFWQIPVWKRALVFVFLCRFLCLPKGTCVMFYIRIVDSYYRPIRTLIM